MAQFRAGIPRVQLIAPPGTGKTVEAVNMDAARTFAATNGHLFPAKKDKPGGINLYVFLQRMERAWREDALPAHRRAALDAIPEWQARMRGGRPLAT